MFFFRPKRKQVDYIIIGLGNPGPKYARTRHNLGFKVIEKLAREWTRASSWNSASDYMYLEGVRKDKKFVLIKPTTFMNLSGNALRKAGKKYDFGPEQVLVIHDELDVTQGRIKFKLGGSPAGHKGVASIAGRLGTSDFLRLKMGVGIEGVKGGEHFILEQMSEDEWAEFDRAVELACEGIEILLSEGKEKAIQYVNTHGRHSGVDEVSTDRDGV